jgi:hypothetical protein
MAVVVVVVVIMVVVVVVVVVMVLVCADFDAKVALFCGPLLVGYLM